MKQGEIWWVDFINTIGHEYQGIRPALIIEAGSQIRLNSVISVVPLTSNLENKIDGDIDIARDDENKLYCDSLLKMHHIHSFDRERFDKCMGMVNGEVMSEIKQYLKLHFGL